MAPVPGQDAKDMGNAAFKAGEFATAVGHYTAAVLADRSNPTYPLNRAAAYLKLGKNDDAERDCTTTLSLDAKNVKAWFRRGQARAGLGRIDDALEDFKHTLKLDPANDASKQEIAKLEALKQKAAIASKPRTPIEIPVPPLGGSPSPSSTVKRRRVPIKIVDNDSPPPIASSSKSSVSADLKVRASSSTPAGQSSTVDLLKPVSSRPLNASSPKPPLPPPETPSTTQQLSPPKPATFKELKSARDATRPSTASAAPTTRPGGGIFRPNGKHTLFNTQVTAEPRTTPAPSSATVSNGTAPAAQPSVVSPMTLFTFSRTWSTLSSFDEKWSFLTASVSPQSLPALFKTSLEAPMLASLLQTFLHVLQAQQDPAIRFVVKAYLLNLAKVPRFTTVVLFMSKQERKLIDEVWSLVGPKAASDTNDDVEGQARTAWGIS